MFATRPDLLTATIIFSVERDLVCFICSKTNKEVRYNDFDTEQCTEDREQRVQERVWEKGNFGGLEKSGSN